MYQFKPHEKILLSAYKRAAEGGVLSVPMATKSDAAAFRTRCYAFAKVVRREGEGLAPEPAMLEVLGWVDSVSARIVGDGALVGWELVLERKDQNAGMKAALMAMGGGEGLYDPQAAAMAKSLERVQSLVQEPSGVPTAGGGLTPEQRAQGYLTGKS